MLETTFEIIHLKITRDARRSNMIQRPRKLRVQEKSIRGMGIKVSSASRGEFTVV